MGGDSPVQSLPPQSVTAPPQQYTPNLNAAYQKYMPSSYFTGAPQRDPSSILNAYAANIPAFQDSLKSSSSPLTTSQDSMAQQSAIDKYTQQIANAAKQDPNGMSKQGQNNQVRNF